MGTFISHAKLAASTVVTAATLFSLTLTFAAESGDKKVGAGLPSKPAETKVSSPAKTETPGDKKSEKPEGEKPHKARKPARHKTLQRTGTETALPGVHLTVKQVMEILKTTRDFSGKNLSGLRLTGLDLSRCNFRGADLSNADLQRADLDEAILERADLSGANLKMTDMRLTGLKGVRLDRAVLDGSIWQDGTICAGNSIGSCKEK